MNEFEDEVRQLMAAGKKIRAVKKYREQFKCSLREAVDAVERLDKDGPASSPSTSSELSADSDQVLASEIPEHVMDEILDALERGRKVEACKLYRSASGKSLRESKEFVESLMDRMGAKALVSVRSGCAGLMLLAATGLPFLAVIACYTIG